MHGMYRPGGAVMANTDTPRPSDDLETAERKSRSVNARVPDREGPDVVPAIQLPGALAANVPQQGLGAAGPLEGGDLGPREAALGREGRVKRRPSGTASEGGASPPRPIQ